MVDLLLVDGEEVLSSAHAVAELQVSVDPPFRVWRCVEDHDVAGSVRLLRAQ